MEKSPDDECRTLLKDALQLSQTTKHPYYYSTWEHPIRDAADETDAFSRLTSCQQSIQQVSSTEMTPTGADRKLLEAAATRQQQHQQHKDDDEESIVKIRLFLATAALWIVWLLVYVILSHWRLI